MLKLGFSTPNILKYIMVYNDHPGRILTQNYAKLCFVPCISVPKRRKKNKQTQEAQDCCASCACKQSIFPNLSVTLLGPFILYSTCHETYIQRNFPLSSKYTNLHKFDIFLLKIIRVEQNFYWIIRYKQCNTYYE